MDARPAANPPPLRLLERPVRRPPPQRVPLQPWWRRWLGAPR